MNLNFISLNHKVFFANKYNLIPNLNFIYVLSRLKFKYYKRIISA